MNYEQINPENGQPVDAPDGPPMPDGPTVDVAQLFATIGEYEVIKRMMAADIARLQSENAALREDLEAARTNKKAK